MTTWRDEARPIIYEVIQRVGRDDEKALRKALRDAYPWGERHYWPYKVWCDEINLQLGKKKLKAERKKELLDQQNGQKKLF